MWDTGWWTETGNLKRIKIILRYKKSKKRWMTKNL